jgi:hypothetical protein
MKLSNITITVSLYITVLGLLEPVFSITYSSIVSMLFPFPRGWLFRRPGRSSRYSDSFRAGWFAVQTPVGQEVFSSTLPSRPALVPTQPHVQRVPRPFQGVKLAGEWR